MKTFGFYSLIAVVVLGFGSAVYFSGHTPENELEQIKYKKEDCSRFHKAYDEIKPAVLTKTIASKIADCKKYGAWEETKK